MDIYKKFTKDVGIVGITEIIMKLKPLIFLPIFTKTLGASDYGVYTTLIVTITFFGTISSFGLGASIIRFLSSEKDKRILSSKFFSVCSFLSITSIISAFLMFIFAETLANTVFGDPGSVEVIRIGSLLLPLSFVTTFIDYFRIRRQMLTFSLVKLSDTLGSIGLAVVFLLMGYGLLHVIYAFIITKIILIIISLILILKDIGLARPNLMIVGPYLKFGLPLVLGSLSISILNVGDRYVIGFMMSSVAVGIYSVAYNLANVLLFFLHAIDTALLAPLSKAYDESKMHQVKNYLSYSMKYFLMFSIPATIGLAILSPVIIRSLTTAEFVDGSMAITTIVALSNIMYGLYLINVSVLFLIKRTTWSASLVIVAAIANIFLNILLVPVLGIVGSAIATLICFTGQFIAASILSAPYIKISIDPVFLSKSIAAASLMGIILYFIAPKGWVNIVLAVLLGAGIYFGVLFLLKAFKKTELKFFKSLIKRQEVILD
ncbi:MAG: oligosaccharide flippase family protein [Candidatus Altiarchaeota archaeon]|nr:oligosaccharide flippase family protein [Candidatus Altiarchaeota archaeon]